MIVTPYMICLGTERQKDEESRTIKDGIDKHKQKCNDTNDGKKTLSAVEIVLEKRLGA